MESSQILKHALDIQSPLFKDVRKDFPKHTPKQKHQTSGGRVPGGFLYVGILFCRNFSVKVVQQKEGLDSQ